MKISKSSILLPKVQLFEIDPSSTCPELTESVEMITSLFAGPGEPDKEQLFALIRNRFFRVFVLKKNDLPQGQTVAGVVVISSFGFKNVVHLEYTVINEVLQGKGLGILIMQSLISFLKAENRCQGKGPKYLTLECEEKLINFYAKTSFQDSKLSPLPCLSEISGKKSIILYKWMEAQLCEENVFVDRNIMELYRKQLIGRLLFVRSFLDQARCCLSQ
jgi:GNAT superfamily N-acetyltransferase